jgi:Short-chain alcohol dehydrogenase of unknown specificity
MPGVSIITGGGSGIGAALARRLVSRSCPVVIVGRRQEKLRETQQSCSNPELVRTVVADISQPESHSTILSALGEHEKVKALVHNAAVLEPVGKLMQVDPKAWRRHMEINVDGTSFSNKGSFA